MIEIKNVSYFYNEGLKDKLQALNDISFKVEENEFISVLGPNGSGKSTIAHLLNGLLIPAGGEVLIDGLSTTSVEDLIKIRQKVGLLFQNPDNQIIATTVEEDIAFGPENLGIERNEIIKRVNKSLDAVSMHAYKEYEPHNLSAGQKQKVALASTLAMQPKYLVLDEPTSYLDPLSRLKIIKLLRDINKKSNIAVINITHYPEQIFFSDRILVMNEGKLFFDGRLSEFLQNKEALSTVGIKKNFYDIKNYSKNTYEQEQSNKGSTYISLGGASLTYLKDTPLEVKALDDISISIAKKEAVGVIGPTGSGKSTLGQVLTGLITADDGDLLIDGKVVFDELASSEVYRYVSYLFQKPEKQLFENDIYSEVAYGPKNLGYSKDEIDKLVRASLEAVGLDFDKYKDRSPFNLSGGEMRRVGIASVLSLNSSVIVMDEPTAGLDIWSKRRIIDLLNEYKKEKGFVLISHDIDEVIKTCNRIIVLNKGKIVLEESVTNITRYGALLKDIGIFLPEEYIKENISASKVKGYGG